MYPAIEEHGMIGNLRTAALVSTDGTINFFCPLRFDNPTLFASLLDDDNGGYCSIRPIATQYRRKEFYIPDTNVLITWFLAPEGIAAGGPPFRPIFGEGWGIQPAGPLVYMFHLGNNAHSFSLLCKPVRLNLDHSFNSY
jgi:hypothetical protein